MVDWIAVARAARRVEYVFKPATMGALVAVALLLAPASAGERAWFVVALLFGLAGDVFLMLPEDRFIQGLAAFLVGHLAYVAGFATAGGRACAFLANACAVGSPALVHLAAVAALTLGLLALGAPLLARLLGGARRAALPGLVPAVALYSAVISAMLASAVLSGSLVAAAGALLFYASDTLIGWTRFVGPMRGGRVAVIVTYHTGQALLVLSLVGALSH